MSDLIDKISKKGSRLTKQRQAILESLTHAPQSADQIMAKLAKQGIILDKSTVYRNLHKLVALKLLAVTQFKNKISVYELVDHNHHHHHIVCENCGKIEDISLEEKALIKAANQKTTFKITSHHLEFFGLCSKCN